MHHVRITTTTRATQHKVFCPQQWDDLCVCVSSGRPCRWLAATSAVRVRPAAGGSADCDSGLATRSCRCKWPCPSTSTIPQEDRRRKEPGETLELYYPATFRKRLSNRGPGHPAWVSLWGHRTGISCAPWSSLPTSLLWCTFWMHLWRRWWNCCRTSRTRSHPIPSRLSMSPRSCLRTSLCERLFATRTWQNSWWGSADDHILFLVAADRGAERRHSSFWSWRANRWSSRFPPEQSSTTLHVSQERISERIVEQIVDFSVFGGGLQDFRPGQSSSSSSNVPAGVREALDEPGEGFFRTFPKNKKKSAKLGPRSSPRVPASVSVSSSTLAAQLVVEPVPVSSEWVQLNDGVTGKTYFWNRRT